MDVPQLAQPARPALAAQRDETRRDMGDMASRHRGFPGEYSSVDYRLAQDGHDST